MESSYCLATWQCNRVELKMGIPIFIFVSLIKQGCSVLASMNRNHIAERL